MGMRKVGFFTVFVAFITALIIVNWSFAGEKPCKEGREISTPTEHYYMVEMEGKEQKHCVYKRFYKNGAKRTLGEYEYGKKTGKWTEWSKDGGKVVEYNYLGGDKHGKLSKWYWNGQKAFQGEYNKDKPIGMHKEWHMDGTKSSEKVYTGKGEDIYSVRNTWYPDGQLKSISKFKNGKMYDKNLQWHKNGKKRSEFGYLDGQRNGECKEWFSNGKQKSRHNYSRGRKTGKSTEWYENGRKKSEGNYTEGKEGLWTYWDKSGAIHNQARYERGKKVK